MTDFALSSRRVLTDRGLADAAVIVHGERIAEVVPRAPAGMPCEDLGDAVLMAGLVDAHVHVNEPGRREWEGFETATRAAAAGGVTTLVDMPLNSTPVTVSARALENKLNAAAGQLWVDVGFWGGAVPGNAPELALLAREGALGAKCFLCHSGIDDFPRLEPDGLPAALRALGAAGAPLLVHAELEHPVAASSFDARSYRRYLDSRPRSFEDAAVALLIDACRATRCPVHVVHLSSASALPLLRQAKDEGLPITAETCPHYLCFAAEDIGDGDTRFKCAPPIRERDNREALWHGLREGLLDVVVSDHSPCTPELKAGGDFLAAWGGIASLGVGLGALWAEASARGFSIADLARWTSARPAELAGLGARKGRIALGYDADLVAWRPETRFRLTPDRLHMRNRENSPYLGRDLAGEVQATWLRGHKIFERGTHLSGAHGTPLLGRT